MKSVNLFVSFVFLKISLISVIVLANPESAGTQVLLKCEGGKNVGRGGDGFSMRTTSITVSEDQILVNIDNSRNQNLVDRVEGKIADYSKQAIDSLKLDSNAQVRIYAYDSSGKNIYLDLKLNYIQISDSNDGGRIIHSGKLTSCQGVSQ